MKVLEARGERIEMLQNNKWKTSTKEFSAYLNVITEAIIEDSGPSQGEARFRAFTKVAEELKAKVITDDEVVAPLDKFSFH